MNVIVSGVTSKDGQKVAYVLFEEEKRSAEAVIPECKVISNKGFSEKEVTMLEQYLVQNLEMLKRQAAGVNPITALMKD